MSVNAIVSSPFIRKHSLCSYIIRMQRIHVVTNLTSAIVIALKQPNQPGCMDESSPMKPQEKMSAKSGVTKSDSKGVGMAESSHTMPSKKMPIKSGGTNSVIKTACIVESSQTKPHLFLDELEVDVTGTIVVMMAGCGMLKEGGIYSIKNFVVLPNKDEYRIFKHDKIMLEFDVETTVRKVSVNGLGFLRYPFQLIDFDRIEPANYKYRLEVVVADDTAHTIVVMFNNTTTELLNFSAESFLGAREDEDDELNLPTAIRNLIGTTHVLEIKSHTYYEYGTFESFTCWKINPIKMVDEGAPSSSQPLSADNPTPAMQRLSRRPSVCTPSKPTKEHKKRSAKLEDSNADEVSGSVKDLDKCNADDALDKKKKKRYIVNGCESKKLLRFHHLTYKNNDG
nr:hypothetical protein [Tanacetum cinerariifolium]